MRSLGDCGPKANVNASRVIINGWVFILSVHLVSVNCQSPFTRERTVPSGHGMTSLSKEWLAPTGTGADDQRWQGSDQVPRLLPVGHAKKDPFGRPFGREPFGHSRAEWLRSVPGPVATGLEPVRTATHRYSLGRNESGPRRAEGLLELCPSRKPPGGVAEAEGPPPQNQVPRYRGVTNVTLRAPREPG